MSSGEDLMEAIESGDEAGVKRCLDDGADPLFADDEGFTVLHMACQEGLDAIATMLLRKGSPIDATDDDGTTPLMLACSGGHADCVAMLVKEGADVMMKCKRGKTALFCAAAVAGCEDATATLLAASADAFDCPVDGKAMHEVAAKKSDACAKLLRAATSAEGASSRLLEACEAGRTRAVEAMLAGGADVAATDDDGWTALHFAASEGGADLCELLLSRGLRADAKAKDGSTPIDLAEEEEHDEAMEVLKKSLE
jgi:ankyrin repeat protein